MAETQTPDPTQPPALPDVAHAIITKLLDPALTSKYGKVAEQLLVDVIKQVLGVVLYTAGEAGAIVAEGLAGAEEEAAPAFNKLTAAAVADLFGVSVAPPVGRGGRGGRQAAANAIGEMLFTAFSGAAQGSRSAAGELQPSDAPAKAFLTTMTQLSLEGWLEGWVMEACSFGQIEKFGELDDKISHTLGLGRAAASVHGPLVKHLITTPLDWKLSKEHRPTLLSAAACAKQIARNPDQRDKWLEDLRRQGYSDERIEALLNEQRKFFSPGDVRTFVAREHWSGDRGYQELVDQGYTKDQATDALRLEGLRRFDQLEDREANAIIDAYVQGDIDRGTFTSMLGTAVTPAPERALLTELAEVKRAANVKQLSLSQVETMVKSGVLSVVDYRRTAERIGYAPDAVIALELQLRWELDKQKAIEDHRRELDAERTAEKAARDAAALARKAAADAKLALQRRGSVADLEAAYVRGLIPLSRVRELYDVTYDGDTAEILAELLQAQRADYVTRLDAAAAAKARAASRGVNVGELETAVATGVLTLDQFRRRLDDLDFDGGDAELLTATLAAKLQARDAAEAKRTAAAAAAKVRRIDLPTIELLVRRGHRTLADYRAVLMSLDFDEAAIAALVERLQIRIDDDAAAANARRAAAARLQSRGLSLDQVRRAVLLGLRSTTDYATFLLQQGFSSADVALLVAELEADRDEADAARQRRAEAERRSQAGKAPLTDVRRAARLGLIPIAAYLARLQAAGYTQDALYLEEDLLTTEMADDAARAAAAEEAAQRAAVKGVTLAQLASAVKAGAAPLDDYYARAIAIGLSPDEAATLTATLRAFLDAREAARRRKDEIAAAGPDRELARADVAKGVKQGLITMDDYGAWLQTNGYDADDAALLVAELEIDIEGAGGGGSGA